MRRSINADDKFFQGGFASNPLPVSDALNLKYFFDEFPYSSSEAACAFRLPSPPAQDRPGLSIRRSRTSCASLPYQDEKSGDTRLLLNEHGGMLQPVSMNINDRMRHMFIIGQTGTGKSTLMESLILQDIRAGRGAALIDPHGDLVDSVLAKMPESRQDDVILFDVLDRARPVGFNIIEYETPEERDLIIEELYLTLDRTYDMKQTGGPIFEMYFRGMLKLLMPDIKPEGFVPTLLEFPQCFLNSKFREWLKENMDDKLTHDFLAEIHRVGGDASLQNVSPYVTSKLNRFIHDTTLRRIVGQEKTSFNFNDIINQGKVFLVKLNKGRFGTQVSAILANQIISRIKMASMKRGELNPRDRRDFFLYVDEAHNIPPEDMMQMLSEARKFRLGLILATQYALQFTEQSVGKNNLLSAVLGNVGTIVIFRLGQEDAKLLSPMLSPQFSSLDIVGLPNWQGYARMQLSIDSLPPFSFKTCMDTMEANEEVAKKVKEQSSLRYGQDIDAIDDQIERRREVWKVEEVEKENE